MICKACGGEFDRENFDLCPYCLEPVVEEEVTRMQQAKEMVDVRTEMPDKEILAHIEANVYEQEELTDDSIIAEETTYLSDENKDLFEDKQDCSIEMIDSFSTRSKNVLHRNNIFTVRELMTFLETERIEDIRNAGAKTTEEIYTFVKQYKEGTVTIPETTEEILPLVDKRYFINMDESNYQLPVSSLGELGLTPKMVKDLNANGFVKSGQLVQITDGEIIRYFGKRSIEAFQRVATILEKNIFSIYGELLSESVKEKDGQIFLRRASGETLQEVADNPGIEGEAKLTRERIRQIESKYFRRNRGFVKTIVEGLKGNKKYFLLQDIMELYDNDDFDRVIIYVCKLLDEYEFLDFAGVFVEANQDEKTEDVILQLAREFVGEGIDLYENLEELEGLFYANNLEYMSLGEFINLLQKYNYHFYKDYVVRGKASYGLLCMNIIRKHFPDGIKLSQSVGEHGRDLENLRKLVTETYGEVSMPDSDRALSSTLIRFGLVLCDRGKYIAPEKIHIDEFALQNIKQYIDEKEEEIVYYTEIFAEFEGLLSMTSSIDNYNYLHGVLMMYYPEDYEYTRDYLVKKTGQIGSGETIADRLYTYLLEMGRPVHKNELRRHFVGMSDAMLFMPMSYDKRMVQWDYNYYTVMELFDINVEDKRKIEAILKSILDENKGYSSGEMLFNEVCKQMPEFVSKNSLKSDTNLYYMVSRLFEDICDFRRPHIGEKGKFERFSTVDVALHLLGYPERLLYTQFVSVAEKMCWSPVTSGVVFSEIEDGYIRISYDEYVEKNKFVIGEAELEKIKRIVLKNMTNDVLPLQNCVEFDEYPEIGYKWNEFLLGSILETHIDEIKVVYPLIKDRRYQKGIAVTTKSALKSYPEIVAYVMISNDIQSMCESQFLSFLVIHGLTRKVIPQELMNSDYVKYENERYVVIA